MKLFHFAIVNLSLCSRIAPLFKNLAIILFCFSHHFCFASQTNDFTGHWKLDPKQSTKPETEFKGKLRTSALKWKARQDKGLPDGPYRERLADYEKQHLDSQKRKSAKNLKRLGLLLPLINCQSIRIEREITDDVTQFNFIYDNILERKFTISNTGRIFSAKGKELSKNIFGFTLAYFDENKLILETDTYDGHRIKEELSISANRLNYRQIFDSFILTKKVTINKLFTEKTMF